MFENEQMTGVAAHCWNGSLLVQAPASADMVTRACVEESRRPVTAVMGPTEQVRLALRALELESARAQFKSDEALLALDLAVLPTPRGMPDVVCRPPLDEERDLLRTWRVAYDVEALGVTITPEAQRRSADFLDAQIAAGHAWVALHEGVPVSLSALNASLPDLVQLGGIYTPPECRGRGYARAAARAALEAARERGASRAVLFTGNPNAQRTYEAVGFTPVGKYSLFLLAPTQEAS
jgi:GNAT superfamily N-acetyltransferase